MCCISQGFVVIQMPDNPQLQWLQKNNNKHLFCAHGSMGRYQLSRAGLQASGTSCSLGSDLFHIPRPGKVGYALFMKEGRKFAKDT